MMRSLEQQLWYGRLNLCSRRETELCPQVVSLMSRVNSGETIPSV